MVFIQPTKIFYLIFHLVLWISPIQARSLSNIPSFQRRAPPAECADPPAGSCTFYADCLENVYHCGPSGYPIGYGQHFCQAFTAAKSTFSTQGQQWLVATMQCLQVALVPEATGQDKPTCSALSDKAFESHASCYVDNGLCSLPVSDWVKIVQVVGLGTLVENWNAIKSSISAAFDCLSFGAWIAGCELDPSIDPTCTAQPA